MFEQGNLLPKTWTNTEIPPFAAAPVTGLNCENENVHTCALSAYDTDHDAHTQAPHHHCNRAHGFHMEEALRTPAIYLDLVALDEHRTSHMDSRSTAPVVVDIQLVMIPPGISATVAHKTRYLILSYIHQNPLTLGDMAMGD